ncbi:DNA repair protein RadA [Sporanaerobacter acetigenes]|uniref:DNA repair protein RadA n=1 Tax=Sporanaerobacter acetigenes DSM 13106 TaxID=1123281 RepID=A0A1M5YQB7_9FIRM|nr:DNA repair protein RadA [Sporanaerobacter acetigenes]SHI14307.1 DNA repair protein RadA/Sms [Sporanaerobacter acetigenes DSM 13106]
MGKTKTKFVCQNCGYETFKWMGKCPSCNEWNSFVEEIYEKRDKANIIQRDVSVEKLIDVEIDEEDRIKTDMEELDRVLGGGIVKGSLILVGGDPGIGKSTLLIQVANHLSNKGLKILYVSGEESPKQVKMRAERLNLKSDELYILSETNLDIIRNVIEKILPNVLIIDSIQTVYNSEIASAPGSVSQVREATHVLMKIAKRNGIATFIVGHVTKEGSIAGPRVLEHMVDTVLYFEGEMYQSYRILRAVKNRFGSTNEIGMFEMRDIGLVEVKNPSEVLLSGRPENSSGTVVVPSMEGTRPMLVEIQSLVSATAFGMPRRTAMGIDYNRVVLMVAVLEKKIGYNMQNSDVYINIAGGLQTKEPAIDLGIITSIASSYRDIYVDPNTVIMGEVGLTGEVRRISFIDKRIYEASKLGFNRAIIPNINTKDLNKIEGIDVIGVDSVEEAMEIVLGG